MMHIIWCKEHRKLKRTVTIEACPMCLVDRIDKLEASLASLIPFMGLAFEAEGDTFGLHHNDATDALAAAELLLGPQANRVKLG